MNSRFDHFHTHRRTRRLKDFDYSQPAVYFVTIDSLGSVCLFGEVGDRRMHLNPFGKIVEKEWLRSEFLRDEIFLDKHVVMPNHIHGIVVLAAPGTAREVALDARGYELAPESFRSCSAVRPDGATNEALFLRPKSLGSFVGGFKSSVTTRINHLRNTPRERIWQPRFHDHIIRNEREWWAIRRYIRMNPVNWKADDFHPGEVHGIKRSQP